MHTKRLTNLLITFFLGMILALVCDFSMNGVMVSSTWLSICMMLSIVYPMACETRDQLNREESLENSVYSQLDDYSFDELNLLSELLD